MKKNHFRFIPIILIMVLSLLGCTEAEHKTTIDNQQVVQESEQNSNLDSEISVEQGNLGESPTTDNNLQVHFIDVGQGNSTFIVSPDGKTMLYDVGGEDETSGRVAVDYIKSIGYDHIDVAVFTHPHSDHINGAPIVFKELKVNSVYYPKVTHTTKTFENFVEAVNQAGLKFKPAKAGVEIPFGEVKAEILAPISYEYENLNDYSAAIKLSWKGKSILLTGDVEKTSEKEMISSNQDLDVDILLVPHHGSNTSTTDEFLNETTPNYAVISCGKENSYGHPHKEVMDRLNKRNIRIFNTAEDGTIVATMDEVGIHITAVGKGNTNHKAQNNGGKVDTEKVSNTPDSTVESNKIEKLDVAVFIDNPNPKQNSDINLTIKVTANDYPVENARVEVLNHYKSKTSSYEGITDKDGIAKISYGIGRASSGFEVKIDVIATKDDLETRVQTSFIPQ